ncbi:MAG: DASS family sodium-coupled anion symporter [Candidatus Heimdallarchaeota archaeon]|nr:DASS family sodium-coupled anion symporter [Candidatus Heimdallarchaeota archaeon]
MTEESGSTLPEQSIEKNAEEDLVEKEKLDETGTEQSREKGRTPEEAKAYRNKIIKTSVIALVIIGLTIGASFLGPKNMEPGLYQVKLTFDLEGQNYFVDFNITMAKEGSSVPVEYFPALGSSGNSCIIITSQAYQSSTNSKITFNVGILDNGNNSLSTLDLTDVTAQLTGENINRKIRPIKVETIRSITLEEAVHTVYFEMAVPYKAGTAFALLALIASLWITEIVPTIVGSFLVPIIVVIFGISSAGAALSPFFHPVIALFFGGFILAEALKKHNIDRRLALSIVSRASIRPPVLMLIMIGVSAFLSMWMSNTASAAIMIPIAIAMLEQIKGESESFKKALVLGIGYAATTGGIASVIGTPANPIAIAGLESIGIEISFLKWFAYGLPIVIIMLLLIWGYLLLVFKPKVPKESLAQAKLVFKEDLKKMGKIGGKEWLTISVFLITIALWLTQGFHGISSGIIALVAVVLIFSMSILEPKDVKKVNWNSLFLFGGGLTLGDALISTGIGDWIASKMGIIEGKHFILIAFIVGGISLIVTAVASNTASAAMLVPLVIPIAVTLQIDPVMLAVIAAIGSSVDYALVFGTPPTMISYSTGYFSVREIFKIGAILDLLGIVILSTVTVGLWAVFGLVAI